MRGGGILDGQAAIQKLVRLEILAARDSMRVVILGEKAPRAQDQRGDAMLAVSEAARLLGRELGDAIDVAGLQGREILLHPPCSLGAGAFADRKSTRLNSSH